jgi:glycosyltransferase involved in cell wall biosynthesis
MRVVTSHPGKQVVVYSMVGQLVKRNNLRAHLASVYYDPSKFRYAAWRYLPRTIRHFLYSQLGKRHSTELPAGLVLDGPWIELVLAAACRTPVLSGLLSGRAAYRCTNWFHDRRAAHWVRRQKDIDAIVAFQGAALKTLEAARAINATAVLVATHPIDHEEIVAKEYARYGIRMVETTTPHVLAEAAAADCILTASSYTTEALVRRGIPTDRIKEIPYGFDFDWTGGSNVRQIDHRPVRFLFVGKLSLHKGLRVLKEAFDAFPIQDVTLTLIGRPVGSVERELMNTWVDPRVRVVPEVTNIVDEYFNADVFVLPSLVEGFGMVTLEAMATGLPVIVTDRCSTVVRDNIDGYVVPAGSAAELRAKMIHLCSCPRERNRLGQNAMQRAREFTWNGFGDRFVGWLESVSGKSHSGTVTSEAPRV